MDFSEEGLLIMYQYIYESKKIELDKLSRPVMDYIKLFRPRLPADEFPEVFPDDDGYDGTYFTIYRGFCFRKEEDYNRFMESISNGYYHSDTVSSWTLNDGAAKRFARGAGLIEKSPDYYKGVILELTPVMQEDIFFASYYAHSELESEFRERFDLIDDRKQHSKQEDEIVLLPGSFPITIIHDGK